MPSEDRLQSAIVAQGKFFSRAGQKFFLKAMRLPEVGPTLDLSQQVELCARLEALRDAHTTALVLDEAQCEPVLDLAARSGLHALIELKVDPLGLLTAGRVARLLSQVAHSANIWRGHPALIGYLIDCPIALEQLRELGVEHVQRALRRVIHTIRLRDTQALIAFKHRPRTLSLAVPAEDFVYATAVGLAPAELGRFVSALHDLAIARPVVIEFPQAGAGQNEIVETAFALGAAGVVAFPVRTHPTALGMSFTPMSVREAAPFLALNGTCPPLPPRAPMVSVVICAYNAERTIRLCLESLTRLKYSNYEVVIVDDGSRDRTAEIAMEFPQFRLIRQRNKGLSVARNVGLHAANGEIIAYTDSDCAVDPDWLTLMVHAMTEGGLDGCGGPNYAPPADGRVEACVAASPGAPCEVLLAAGHAEHLAGCNMVFSKAALIAVDGFDAQFTAAGDDVDICWRLLEAGYRLGYSPAAMVWHFRRNTIEAYYGQQRGYGRAEAQLYIKYPERFNALGQIKWRGNIPGFAATVPGGVRRRIGWTSAVQQWQTVNERSPGIANFLPQTLEWHVFWAAAAALAWVGGLSVLPALAMLALGPVWALYYAKRAPLEKRHDTRRARLLVTLLAWSGPLARAWERWKARLNVARDVSGGFLPPQRPVLRVISRSLYLSYWNEAWTTRDALLERLVRRFSRAGVPVIADTGWNDFDLEVRPDPWTRLRLKTADEEHESARLKNHVALRVRLSWLSRISVTALGIATLASATLGSPLMAAALAALAVASSLCAVREALASGRFAYHAVEQCAQELNLVPLGRPSAAAARLDRGGGAAIAAGARRARLAARLFAGNRAAVD
jgi:glycosyltransferase involved in cell wall biosynthesis